uniref:Putative secreted protein n=1 Tax=Ixodes ricinus TaxID=34613 RepID=A0A147BE61_IXORI
MLEACRCRLLVFVALVKPGHNCRQILEVCYGELTLWHASYGVKGYKERGKLVAFFFSCFLGCRRKLRFQETYFSGQAALWRPMAQKLYWRSCPSSRCELGFCGLRQRFRRWKLPPRRCLTYHVFVFPRPSHLLCTY